MTRTRSKPLKCYLAHFADGRRIVLWEREGWKAKARAFSMGGDRPEKVVYIDTAARRASRIPWGWTDGQDRTQL